MYWNLPRKQYELLYLLAANEGQVFTHGRLVERIWGYDADNSENTPYCQITKLRNSLQQFNKLTVHNFTASLLYAV